jgi:hypothetical protein
MSTLPSEIYSFDLRFIEPGTSDVTLNKAPAVPRGKVVRIDTLIICDETTANKTLALGVNIGGKSYTLKKQPAGASAYGLALEVPLILSEGERPMAIVSSPTANDVITFLARGVYL